MELIYQTLDHLLKKSPFIEDAAYAIQSTIDQRVYATGSSKSGSSSCASQSKCGNSRASAADILFYGGSRSSSAGGCGSQSNSNSRCQIPNKLETIGVMGEMNASRKNIKRS